MRKIRVNLGKRSYDAVIGAGAVARLPRVISAMDFTGPVVIISDKTVAAKTVRVTSPVFKNLPKGYLRILVNGSERSKSLKVFQDTIHKIAGKTRTYKPLIIAVGGGVVGDLAGFIAATYRRGIPLIHVPTTLLAQVDSSIGGKVGIDLPEAKNMVGAFYQPRIVLMDPVFLRTLPDKQIRNGMAEVIKYAVIKDSGFFEFLENNIRNIMSLKNRLLEQIIHKCVEIKARIVEADEFDDQDVRIILNFGHTLGHAIEAASGYSTRYNHGESVALGMILAGEIALRLDMLNEKDLNRIKGLIKKAGLPTKIRRVSLQEIMNSFQYDKKFITGSNRFVLPKKIGSVEVVEDIPGLLIKTVLRKYVE